MEKLSSHNGETDNRSAHSHDSRVASGSRENLNRLRRENHYHPPDDIHKSSGPSPEQVSDILQIKDHYMYLKREYEQYREIKGTSAEGFRKMYLQKIREASYLISLKKIHPKIFLDHYPSCVNDLKEMMNEMEQFLYNHNHIGNIEGIINRCKKLGIILNDEDRGLVSSHKGLKRLSHTYDSIIRKITTNITAIGSIRSQHGYNLMDKDIEERVDKIVKSSQFIQEGFDSAISILNRGDIPHHLGALDTKVANFRTLAEELEQFTQSLTAIYKKHTIERWLQDTSKESDTPE